MWWHHLGLRLTLGTAALLLLAMLLVDGVVSALWYSAEQRALRLRLEAVLDRAVAQVVLRQQDDAPTEFFFSLAAASGSCLLLFSAQEPVFRTCSGQEALFDPNWRGKAVPWRHVRPLHAERDLRLRDGKTLTVRVVSMEPPVLQQVLAAQGYVLIYIVVNLLALSVIAFFRFTRHIQRPLQSLITATDRMPEQGPRFFSESLGLNELHRLSFSLNSMLRRLERDRLALQAATRELTTKNEQLLANQREMIRTEKLAATGRLAAGLAHEIGNPLGVVQGYLELLQMEEVSDCERQEYCRNALRETERMHTLITHLLQTARTSSAAGELIDMHRLLAEYVAVLRPQALFKGIDVQLRLEADNALVVAEDAAMRQVLLNALLNAVDAIRAAGTGQGSIVVSTRQREREGRAWLDVCVSDNGSGLAPEHAAQIFDPFFTTKEPGMGTGLGLSVSLALVESMGGGLYAVNREEGGMILHIELPQAMPVMPAEPHVEA